MQNPSTTTSKPNQARDLKSLRLPVWGPARLEFKDRVLSLRQKSLAILYYLAFEGQADRQVLAELLWENNDPHGNLRVELHHLRKMLTGLKINAFPRGQNPLRLPAQIRLENERVPGEPLAGLERMLNASPQFETWLEWRRRAVNPNQQEQGDREDLLSSAARRVRVPGLVILQGLPGSDRTSFARGLARKLNLPFVEGFGGPDLALKYSKPPFSPEARQAVMNNSGVIVFSRSAFGETPRLLLEIEEILPSDRIVKLSLPPLTWKEVRQGVLANQRFNRAARLYIASQGVPAHLRERLQAGDPQPLELGQLGPPPAKTLSKLQLEMRYLSLDARIALEKLAVQPGNIAEGLAQALGAEAHLEEFERRGWFSYTTNWHFSHESVRRVLHEGLQPGRRVRTHGRAAQYFLEQGDAIQEAYHRMLATERVNWGHLLECLNPEQQLILLEWQHLELQVPATRDSFYDLPSLPAPPLETHWVSNREHALLESLRYGEGVSHEHGTITVARTSGSAEASGIVFSALDETTLVRLSGRAALENIFGFGLSGDAMPLGVGVFGSPEALRFVSIEHPVLLHGRPLLPTPERFEHWFVLPRNAMLHLHSRLEQGILELELSAYSLATDGQQVQAYPLEPQFPVSPPRLETMGAVG